MAKIIRNLAEMRAQRLANAPAIVAPDGREFPIKSMTVDAYLSVLELEQRFEELRGKEQGGSAPQRDAQRELFTTAKDMILQFVPGFPVGDLDLDELFMVLSDVQTAHTPAAKTSGGAAAEAAESGAPGE